MKRKLTSEELAEAWKAGVMPLHTAVRRHFKSIGIWPVHEKVMVDLELILGFGNMGCWDTLVPVAEGEEMSVGQIVERYQLTDFLG
ncbi:MAG TPA: hypothetical protein VH592_26670 [Gemmataceae bacterium]|jgi:hypothetical protein